jgi:hypothetical protein
VSDMHLMLVDGKVVHVDMGPMLRRHRAEIVRLRADAIGPAADLTADEAFSTEEVKEMWQRSGLSHDDLDAAANAALVLYEVEHYGVLGED